MMRNAPNANLAKRQTLMKTTAAALATLAIASCSSLTGTPRAEEVPPTLEGDFQPTALGATSPFEFSILRSGTVTEEDLLRAEVLVLECLETAGIATERISDRHAPSSIVSDFPVTKANEEAEASCREQVNSVEEVWVLLNAPDEAEVEAASVVFASCMTSATGSGVPLSIEEAIALYGESDRDEPTEQAVEECADTYRWETITPFPGVESAWNQFITEEGISNQ